MEMFDCFCKNFLRMNFTKCKTNGGRKTDFSVFSSSKNGLKVSTKFDIVFLSLLNRETLLIRENREEKTNFAPTIAKLAGRRGLKIKNLHLLCASV